MTAAYDYDELQTGTIIKYNDIFCKKNYMGICIKQSEEKIMIKWLNCNNNDSFILVDELENNTYVFPRD